MANQNPIDQGSNTALHASGADDYLWSPVTGLNKYTGQQVTANPSENITYYLTGTNEFGCKGYDSLELFVYCPACEDNEIQTTPYNLTSGCANLNLYKNNLYCSWTLYPDAISKIYLYFEPETFDVKPGDWVIVYNSSQASEDTIGKFNNDHPPSGNIEGGSTMFIEFITDDSIAGTGFQAEWSGDPSIGMLDPNEQNIRVYPNPVSDILYIESNKSEDDAVRIYLYNSLGQIVLNRKWDCHSQPMTEKLDLSKFRTGIYHLIIVTSDGIIKQKISKIH
jgi:hypothetical protein